ncbi:hypothetical protein DCS_00183 [Drechmeria coniospora]|uniref:Uncharacterized protein n=1 Tax=Drechmeria coniospora TaxID=98403 RepID=A0A151GPN4_DRECN|nr:hypothetical protein DCS_00183 [Drechmeria coniospora]KYK59056.1 hypothetical protein DCS_00183 [Drechmeria coniospora]
MAAESLSARQDFLTEPCVALVDGPSSRSLPPPPPPPPPLLSVGFFSTGTRFGGCHGPPVHSTYFSMAKLDEAPVAVSSKSPNVWAVTSDRPSRTYLLSWLGSSSPRMMSSLLCASVRLLPLPVAVLLRLRSKSTRPRAATAGWPAFVLVSVRRQRHRRRRMQASPAISCLTLPSHSTPLVGDGFLHGRRQVEQVSSETIRISTTTPASVGHAPYRVPGQGYAVSSPWPPTDSCSKASRTPEAWPSRHQRWKVYTSTWSSHVLSRLVQVRTKRHLVPASSGSLVADGEPTTR